MSLTILYGEDDPDYRRLFSNLFIRHEVAIEHYNNFDALMGAVQTMKYDLLVTDASMPGKNYAVENVVNLSLSRHPTVPIYILSKRGAPNIRGATKVFDENTRLRELEEIVLSNL